MAENTHFLGDNPIERIEDDLFNFEHYALKVQQLIQLNSNDSTPLTIGIYGKWGEGKTSFLKLIENKIDVLETNKDQKGILKYHFNPWRYSTEEEMLFDFFDGLAKTMFVEKDSNLQKVGKGLLRFSKYLKAVKISASVGISPTNKISATLEPSEIFKALGEDFVGKDITLDKLKDKVNEALAVSNYKVAVFIDDIDRLDKNEIYTILKIVKLNGSFNDFMYLIPLDSEHVSKAISKRYGDEIKDGRFFLEKIINIPIHLPRIEEEDLKYFFEVKFSKIKRSLSKILKTDKKEEFKSIIDEFSGRSFNSPREILKVINSFLIGAFSIGDEVNLRDLFWIESLKVKDEELYNILKKYSFDSLNSHIDFNDEISAKPLPVNGTRKFIFDKHRKSFMIFNLLFPVNDGSFPLSNKIDAEELDENLKINSVLHYDKYFTYHSLRKVSNVKLKIIEQKIKDKNSVELVELFRDFFKQTVGHRAYYKIEDLVKNISVIDGRDFFYEFIIDNINIIPDYGIDIFGYSNSIRIIENIAKKLSNDDDTESKFIIELANKMDVVNLCHFTRKFKDEKVYKEELEKIIVSKIEFNISDKPFYYDVKNISNKMMMHYWKKYKNEDYNNKIKGSLVDEEAVYLLIRNFPSFWNNEFFGGLTEDTYQYMKELIDVDFVFKKLEQYNQELVDSVKIDEFKFIDMDKSSIEENVQQFIYWYKLENSKKIDVR